LTYPNIAVNTNALKEMPLHEAVSFIRDNLGCSQIEITTDGRAHAYSLILDDGLIFPKDVEYICLSGGWVDFLEQDLLLLRGQVKLASRLRCPRIRLFTNNIHNDISVTLEGLSTIIKNIKYVSYLYPSVALMFENHGGYTSTVNATYNLMHGIGRENVFTVYDPANYVKSGDTLLSPLPIIPYISHIHVKDIDVHGNFCPVGEGVIPWIDLIKTFQGLGYQGFYSVEYEGTGIPAGKLAESYYNFIELYEEATDE